VELYIDFLLTIKLGIGFSWDAEKAKQKRSQWEGIVAEMIQREREGKGT
jgi:hypothetical protein